MQFCFINKNFIVYGCHFCLKTLIASSGFCMEYVHTYFSKVKWSKNSIPQMLQNNEFFQGVFICGFANENLDKMLNHRL